ncbi:scavenger receptor cysteine-rich domain-containing protein DMBT1-like [Paramisgurnus dabryanus]|uniref:scavenger receptor cysteine-rich domain-containing protein DMBT1-like n=1 Tax=Paramisgurnus dabryanus TaxID=90735 RepID=UPI003CCF601D
MLYFLYLVLLLDFKNVPQVQATVRLVNGFNRCSGRVEVLYNGQWGTVCGDYWDLSDAAVVCKEMGCGDATEAKASAYFGQGTGKIWMDNVNCVGTESSLINCVSAGWGVTECGHGGDAGVICQDLVRLVNGMDSCSGRVEVFHDGEWGTVCDNGWDLSDAAVVCREVGCGNAREAKIDAYFGEGVGQIWMDATQCTGSETALESCNSTKWDIESCTHSEDAGVFCNPPVRLVNGINSCSGRVEVLHNGQWGTVCKDFWDSSDAAVVCKELGCPTGGEVKSFTFFAPGVGTIWMDDVQCTGTELSLTDCTFRGWGTHNCDHTFDVGIICRDIRLVDGSNQCSGRVEVLYNDQWGTVCDAGWDLTDAAVVCNSMGCGTPIAAETGAFFGQGSGPVWLDDMSCSGNEPSVKNCSSMALGTSTCSHEQDAGVVCNPPVRLVNGINSCSGRVEVLHNGQWGTVCNDFWNTTDASVVCKEVGCPTGGEVKSFTYFGPGGGALWMDDVYCTGTELSLTDCTFRGWGIHNCDHSFDVGVICREPDFMETEVQSVLLFSK